MSIDTVARHSRSALGRALLVLGWVAVLLPAIYMTLVGWNSGEHGGTVILMGLFATVFQLAVWGSVWKMTRRQADVRRLAFGAGAATSLSLSLIALALTVSPAWAGTIYLVSALLTVAIVVWRAGLGSPSVRKTARKRTRFVAPHAEERHVDARRGIAQRFGH